MEGYVRSRHLRLVIGVVASVIGAKIYGAYMSRLFTPIASRGETIPNRVFVSPMCQYSSETEDGRLRSWHLVHYGTRAVGGAGLVIVEATAVQPKGRIIPWDAGLYRHSRLLPTAVNLS